jgi:hypothetical protein
MSIFKRRPWKVAVLGSALAWTALSLLSQQQCLESTGSTSEDFSSVTNIDLSQSSAKFWCQNTSGKQNIVTLNQLGANFVVSYPVSVPTWVNTMTVGDFDLDGWTDFIGASSDTPNALVFVKNLGVEGRIGSFEIRQWIDGSTGNASGPTRGVGGAPLLGLGHCALTSGDYDGDGDQDFLFINSGYYYPYTFTHAWLYKNTFIDNGLRTGVLNFVRTDMTSAWNANLSGIAWTSTIMTSGKFDADDDVDIYVGNHRGNIMKLTNTNNKQINASTFVLETTPILQATGLGSCGISTVSVADFDGKNGLDLAVGSVSSGEFRFYMNDGTGHYTLSQTIYDSLRNPNDNIFDGAATATAVGDFDQDGDIDVVAGSDYANYGTNVGGKVFFFRNDGSGRFTSSFIFNGQIQNPKVFDFDMGAALDYDNDGDMDFIMADGNHSKSFYVFTNTIAPVYNLQGTAISKNLTSTLDSSQSAISRVRIKNLDQGFLGTSPTGLGTDIYVSNDDGRTWTLYASFSDTGLKNQANMAWLDFKSFGSALRWKAVFRAAKDTMPNYDNASYETPKISKLNPEYVVVAKREYSRTSAVAANLTTSAQSIKALIAASFYYPSFEGKLRAYNVTQMTCSSSATSSLSTVSTTDLGRAGGRALGTGVSILWDAGDLLKARSADDRVIFTVLPGTGGAWNQTSFVRANVGTLGPILNDVDGDNAGLIDFIRGKDRPWKLGDIQHSNPVVVGPPSGNVQLMGIGYDTFMTTNANRTKVVYAGANDGMLHAFEANTGNELWAFIPYNLLSKLKNLSQRDPVSGQRQLLFDYFVDGSPVAADVTIGGVWKTVLICGQGKGKGTNAGSGQNYYFALDVTVPSSPVFLWQTTHPTMGETWSVPAVGKVIVGSAEEWIAFAGSGYDNDGTAAVLGNQLYAIKISNGSILWQKDAVNVNTAAGGRKNPYTDIPNAMPGSPTAADVNVDGRIDSVYIGDLDGRLWKLNVTSSSTTLWTMTAIYTDPDNYPIITKPGLWIDTLSGSSIPHLYFGTGGDDAAPTNKSYSFIALLDQATPTVEWYVGDFNTLNLPKEKSVETTKNDEKFWADPVIADNIVYFSTLKGSIENANPCLNLGDLGQLFARYIQPVGSTIAGGSALRTSLSGTVASLTMASKARQAVTIGERQRVGGTNKREVYTQEYDSTIERLEQPVGALLQIRSWREIFKIIR